MGVQGLGDLGLNFNYGFDAYLGSNSGSNGAFMVSGVLPVWLFYTDLRAWGSGFRVQGSGFRVQGSGFRV